MSHTVTYNPDLQIIETKVSGDLDMNEAKEIISDIVEMGVAHNCFLLLTDYREVVLQLSTVEIVKIPRIIATASTAQNIFPGSFKRALLIARDYEDFHFLETVTLNNMQNARLFHEMEDAIKWLLEK